MQADSKAKALIRSFIPEGAINGYALEPPPAPGMYYDTDIRKWCPESFRKEKEDMFQREKQRILDSTPDEANPGFSVTGKPLSDESSDKGTEDTKPSESGSSTAQQEHRCTISPAAPKGNKTATPKKNAKPKQSGFMAERSQQDPLIEAASSSTAEPPQVNPQTADTTEPQPEAVEQPKKTRRSTKMMETDFDSLAAQFIFPTDLGEKKPLFFPENVRESLRKIAGLVSGGRVSPSHIANHVIEAWIDEHRDLFNRMFANQKTSI